MSAEEILGYFYDSVTYSRTKKGWRAPLDIESLRGVRLDHDLINAGTGRVIYEAGTKLTPRMLREMTEKKGVEEIIAPREELIGRYAAEDIVNESNGRYYEPSPGRTAYALLNVSHR